MSQNLADAESILVQVMAYCLMAPSITWTNMDPNLHRYMTSIGPQIILRGKYPQCHTIDQTVERNDYCWYVCIHTHKKHLRFNIFIAIKRTHNMISYDIWEPYVYIYIYESGLICCEMISGNVSHCNWLLCEEAGEFELIVRNIESYWLILPEQRNFDHDAKPCNSQLDGTL